MELQYELTYDDREASRSYYARELRAAHRTVLYPLLLVAAVGVIYVAFRLASPSPARAGLLFGAAMVVSAFLLRMAGSVRKAAIHRVAREVFYEQDQPEHVWLALEPDGIVTQTDCSAARLSWAAVKRVEKTEAHVLILCRHGESIVIPKRAFQSEQHMRAFLDEMERLRAAATGGLAPSTA